MQVSVSEAKARLTDLVRRAEAGDEVILTRWGQPAVKLVPAGLANSPAERWELLEALRGSARPEFGRRAARSQDWLYDDFGIPA